MGDESRAGRLTAAWVSALLVGTGSNLAAAEPEPPPAASEKVEQKAPSAPPATDPRPPEDELTPPESGEDPEDPPSEPELAIDPYPPPLGVSGAGRFRADRGPFAQGRLRISLLLGGGTSFNDDYLILGGGVGYNLVDGLELSLNGAAWLIGDPFLATVTPGLTYAFVMVPQAHPYLGVFYRHYFIGDGFEDLDTYGGRVGVYLTVGQHGFVGAGVVYERRFDCDEDVLWRECDQWYPEVTVAFVF